MLTTRILKAINQGASLPEAFNPGLSRYYNLRRQL